MGRRVGRVFLDVTPGDERAEVERAAARAEAPARATLGRGARRTRFRRGGGGGPRGDARAEPGGARDRRGRRRGGGRPRGARARGGDARADEKSEREGMMMRRGTGGVFQLLFCAHPPRDALDSQRVRRGIRRPSASSSKPSYDRKSWARDLFCRLIPHIFFAIRDPKSNAPWILAGCFFFSSRSHLLVLLAPPLPLPAQCRARASRRFASPGPGAARSRDRRGEVPAALARRASAMAPPGSGASRPPSRGGRTSAVPWARA